MEMNVLSNLRMPLAFTNMESAELEYDGGTSEFGKI